MIDLYTASVIVFIVVLALILYKDRKNIKRESIFLLRKTTRGRGFLMKLGSAFPRGWNVYGIIGVISGFLISAWGFYYLLDNAINSFFAEQAVGGLSFVVPSLTTEVAIGPGYFAVPFWYWIISLGLLILVHEGSHGIMAVREKLPIKSLGWGILAIIPVAFVEPDEKKLEKREPMTQLKVFAAGSFANFILAGIAAILMISVSLSLFMPSGVGYQQLLANYPAADVNMTGEIVAINGVGIMNLQELNNQLEKAGPNSTITVTTKNGTESLTYTIETFAPPTEFTYKPDLTDSFFITLEQAIPGSIDFSESLGRSFNSLLGNENLVTWSTINYEISKWEYIGDNYPSLRTEADGKILMLRQQLKDHPEPGFIGILNVYVDRSLKAGLEPYGEAVDFSVGLLFFLFLINFGVGLANLLPIKPLDGGRMWDIVFRKYVPKHASILTKALGMITLVLIIANFVLPFA